MCIKKYSYLKKIFLSNFGLIEKPIITEKTKKHLPKVKKDAKKEEAKTETAPAPEKKEEKKADEKENK